MGSRADRMLSLSALLGLGTIGVGIAMVCAVPWATVDAVVHGSVSGLYATGDFTRWSTAATVNRITLAALVFYILSVLSYALLRNEYRWLLSGGSLLAVLTIIYPLYLTGRRMLEQIEAFCKLRPSWPATLGTIVYTGEVFCTTTPAVMETLLSLAVLSCFMATALLIRWVEAWMRRK